MTGQIIASWVSGGVLVLLYTGIACYIAFRPAQQPIDPVAVRMFNLVLAAGLAGFVAIVTGFIEVQGKWGGLQIQAGAGLAVFVVSLFYPVPLPAKGRAPRPGKPRVRKVMPPADPNPAAPEEPPK